MGSEDEDDFAEQFAEQMKKAMASFTAREPDPLVFCLRGSEIRDRLIKMAETAEAEAAKISPDTHTESSNVKMMRPRALPPPPGWSEESQREMNVTLAKTYSRAAEDFRFLEEDRFFRLAANDLAAIGITLGPMALTFPQSGYYR